MKPFWKTAPDWANWLAMDRNGVWHWYSRKPEISEIVNEWVFNKDSRFIPVQQHDWKMTLEERPK